MRTLGHTPLGRELTNRAAHRTPTCTLYAVRRLFNTSTGSASSLTVRAGMLEGLSKLISKTGDNRLSTPLSFSDNAPAWDVLANMVKAQEAELGVNFTNPDLETGPTNALSLKRTFGSKEPIRIKLYRDHAGWCPYCQKVWLQLEEKRIPYIIEKINMRCYGDKPASFLAKVPSGLLPVLEVDGRVVTESATIMAMLEDMFPDKKPLMPPKGSQQRARADNLMRLERRFFSDWLNWLCSGWNQQSAQAQLEKTLQVICQELQAEGGPYFLGSEISLVDITFAPMLERAAASLCYYKGFVMRGNNKFPALEAWFDAMESRPTYLGTKSDHYTHCHDLPPQLGGCHMTPAGEPFAAALDGQDGKSWHLPLPPLTGRSTPEAYSPGENPPVDRLQAAARLVVNHDAVVKFALRGAGQSGPRPVSAPLADPTGVAAIQHTAAMDAALRHVAHALLVGVEEKQVMEHALQVKEQGDLGGAAVVASAEYLRDRVGVPRDMRLPAARQLRAHLNWLIDSLQADS